VKHTWKKFSRWAKHSSTTTKNRAEFQRKFHARLLNAQLNKIHQIWQLVVTDVVAVYRRDGRLLDHHELRPSVGPMIIRWVNIHTTAFRGRCNFSVIRNSRPVCRNRGGLALQTGTTISQWRNYELGGGSLISKFSPFSLAKGPWAPSSNSLLPSSPFCDFVSRSLLSPPSLFFPVNGVSRLTYFNIWRVAAHQDAEPTDPPGKC